MPNEIKCPKCGNTIDVENVVATELEQKFQEKYRTQQQQWADRRKRNGQKPWMSKSFLKKKKNRETNCFCQKLLQEKQKMETDIQSQVSETVAQIAKCN
jgi:flagellar biosynthesis/type III secretory pathway protein FliH